MFYAEHMKAFPDAKVILTVRDPAKWHKSASDTIYGMGKDWSLKVLKTVLPFVGQMTKLTHYIWNVNPFHGDFEDKEKAIQRFNAYIEQVKATVPADKLLIFNVSEGWGPLCKFLEVPGESESNGRVSCYNVCLYTVPSKPFPNVNDTAEFQTRIKVFRAIASAVLVIPAAVLGALAYYYL